MKLTRTLFLVFAMWGAIALVEFVPAQLALATLLCLILMFAVKSKIIRLSLAIVMLSLAYQMHKQFHPPPMFLRYYQYFNPNLTSLYSMIEANSTYNLYNVSNQYDLVFTEKNWISDGERIIHMAAIQPIVLAQSWIKHFDVNASLSYLGPTPQELCERLRHLDLKNVNLYYTTEFAQVANCGESLMLGQSTSSTHLVTYGPLDPLMIPQWVDNVSRQTEQTWSIWHCSESLSRENPRKLPLLSDYLVAANKPTNPNSIVEFFVELPFVVCEVRGSAKVFAHRQARQQDPVIVRQLQMPKERP